MAGAPAHPFPVVHVSRDLSLTCRRYVVAIGTLGLLPLIWAVSQLAIHPPHAAWYLLAGMAILSGPLSIRMPSVQATISVSEGFIFSSVLLFGPAAATVIAVIDGLAVSLWSSKRSGIRVLFGVGEPAISVSLASLLFYQIANVSPLLHQSTPLTPLLLPLLCLTLTYFGLNTLLAGTAVWLDVGGSPRAMLRRHLPHVALDFTVSLSLVAALVQTSGNLTLSAVVVLVPMLLASYISSHHVAGRLEDTNRHLADLRRLYDSTVETLAMAIDAKDQITHGHIRRVQILSRRLALAFGADDRQVQALEAAALLHDLGKLAVPEHILNKPGPLTPGEYDEIKKHADVGASILSAIDFPFPVVPIVRHHHENWDGSGYPDGLNTEAIPLGARILAVVDCYDALTSHRPYRRGMSHDDAIQIIRSRSGRMYDPKVVDTFVRLNPCTDPATGDEPARFRPSANRSGTPALQTAPVFVERAMPRCDRHQRLTQFVARLDGAGWQEAAREIAVFVPNAVPDCVAALFRLDTRSHRLLMAGTHRELDPRVPDTIAIGRGVSGWVAVNKQMMANADAELDLGEIAGIVHPPLRLCLSVPVLASDKVEGVLTVYSPYAFSETDRMLIESLAQQLPSVLSGPAETPVLRPS